MPDSADDMLLEGQQLKKGVADDQGKALLADIRADAAKHPADRLSDLVLARAEIEFGDRTAAEPLLERRLDADPNDMEARLLMARSLMRALWWGGVGMLSFPVAHIYAMQRLSMAAAQLGVVASHCGLSYRPYQSDSWR